MEPLAAVVQELLRVLPGRSEHLVPFGEIQKRLRLSHMRDRGVQQISLDAITGSVNRFHDFDRHFLPSESSVRESLRPVRGAVEGQQGTPPVHLYKVGGAYFVVDGHKRIAVARQVGADSIEAVVQEFPTGVAVEPTDSLAVILGKAARRNFEQATGLAGDEFAVTDAAGWDRLLEHIAVHRWFLGLRLGREIGWGEAVASWRDAVYRPVVAVIGEQRLLDAFPDRTETDLYLWLVERLHRLRQELGDEVAPADAVPPLPWWRRLGRFLRRAH